MNWAQTEASISERAGCDEPASAATDQDGGVSDMSSAPTASERSARRIDLEVAPASFSPVMPLWIRQVDPAGRLLADWSVRTHGSVFINGVDMATMDAGSPC